MARICFVMTINQYQKVVDSQQSEIVQLSKEIESLREENQRLRDILNKNSSNSSKPPSSDISKPKPLSLRGKSGKLSGRQNGHQGYTLIQTDTPTETILRKVEHCSCGSLLKDIPYTTIKKRQVFDIPEPVIRVTEHQVEVKRCPSCGKENEALFPEKVVSPVQYGSNITALASYLMNYQLIPFNRTSVFFQDVFALLVSEGWLGSARTKFSQAVKEPVEAIKSLLLKSEVLHFDETGISHQGERKWLHVVSSPRATYYKVHSKRGTEAMNAIDVLPNFKGTAIHDHWASYYKFDCSHAECIAHTL